MQQPARRLESDLGPAARRPADELAL